MHEAGDREPAEATLHREVEPVEPSLGLGDVKEEIGDEEGPRGAVKEHHLAEAGRALEEHLLEHPAPGRGGLVAERGLEAEVLALFGQTGRSVELRAGAQRLRGSGVNVVVPVWGHDVPHLAERGDCGPRLVVDGHRRPQPEAAIGQSNHPHADREADAEKADGVGFGPKGLVVALEHGNQVKLPDDFVNTPDENPRPLLTRRTAPGTTSMGGAGVKDGPEFRTRLEAAKRASLGHLLVKCGRLLTEAALTRVRSDPLLAHARPSHVGLFPHLDHDGTRLAELAGRMGVTKQAAGQVVDELEAMGLLERHPDPSDRRAKLIRLTDEGRGLMFFALGVLDDVEREALAHLPERRRRALQRDLLVVLEALERAP